MAEQIIKGYAMTSDWRETLDARSARCRELREAGCVWSIDKEPCYGHTKYRGSVQLGTLDSISEYDIAIYIDSSPFGGSCEILRRDGDTVHFRGRYWID